MIRQPQRATRTNTLFPYSTRFRSPEASASARLGGGRGIPAFLRADDPACGQGATCRQAGQAGEQGRRREQALRHAGRAAAAQPRAAGDDVHLSGSEPAPRSEEHTSELQSLMRISYAVFRLTKKKTK